MFIHGNHITMKMNMTSLPDDLKQLNRIIAELTLGQCCYVKKNSELRVRYSRCVLGRCPEEGLRLWSKHEHYQ